MPASQSVPRKEVEVELRGDASAALPYCRGGMAARGARCVHDRLAGVHRDASNQHGRAALVGAGARSDLLDTAQRGSAQRKEAGDREGGSTHRQELSRGGRKLHLKLPRAPRATRFQAPRCPFATPCRGARLRVANSHRAHVSEASWPLASLVGGVTTDVIGSAGTHSLRRRCGTHRANRGVTPHPD